MVEGEVVKRAVESKARGQLSGRFKRRHGERSVPNHWEEGVERMVVWS